jgi:peptidyl-prolyl cis-trans isomerase SurA
MPRLRTVLSPAALVLAAALAACSGSAPATAPEPDRGPVVAEFAGERLTLGQFEDRYVRSSGSRALAAADSMEAYEDFLRRYVDFRLKVREARRLGFAEDPEIVREIAEYRDQLARPYLMEREVMEGIVRDLYEKQREEVAASHLLLMVGEDAPPADTLRAYTRLSAIRDSIVAGQASFRDAVLRHSDDPSKAQNAGDLGYFTGGRMILAFEEMAYNTPVGEVSPVFRTQFGYHILEVRDRRPASPEIRAAHILLRLPPDAPAADSAAAYAQAQALLAELEGGASFDALAREHSEDPGSAGRGGDLGYFARDRMVPEFGDAAFALETPGQRSGIVRSPFGLHLIELTDRRAFPTYEEKYDELKRLAERLPRTALRRQELGRSFRDEVGSVIHTARVERAVAAYPADSILARVRTDRFGTYADSAFATVGQTDIPFSDFAEAFQGARVQPARDQRAQLLEMMDQYLDERAVDFAADRLEARDPEFRRIMQEYTDGVLLFRISEDSVWTAAAQDSVGLRRHYDAHASGYRYPERRRVVALYARADTTLQAAAALLDGGLSPADVRERLRGEDARPALRVDTLYLASRSGAVFDRAFDLEVGARTEPLAYRSERVILRLDGIEAPRQMTFQEARAQVITDYQAELEERLVTRLRAESSVRLYPERLRDAFRAGRAGSVASAP